MDRDAHVAQLVDLYVLGRVGQGEIKHSTGRDERYVLLSFASSVEGTPVAGVTRADVQRWASSCSTIRRQRREQVATLRRFFEHLVEAGAVARSPVHGIDVGEIVRAPRQHGPFARPAPTGALADYITHLRRRGLRDSTIVHRRYTLERVVQHLQGADLLSATREQLVEYVDRIPFTSFETRCSAVTDLQGFYGWALRDGLIAADPSIVLVRPRRPQRLPRPMPDGDVARALGEATDAPMRQWLLLAAFCGLRACEIAQVRRDEIIESAGGAVLIVSNGKGGKARVCPLPNEVLSALRDPELPRSGWLFPRLFPPAGPISAGQVSKRSNRFLRELGIAHTLHSLRHFYGTTMYDQTRDLRLVQELLGHASPVVTSLYTKLAVAEHAGVVCAMPARWRTNLLR